MDKRETLEITSRRLDNQRKRLDIVEGKKGILIIQKKVVMEQISQLRDLLTEEIINEEKTLFGSEPVYKPLLTEAEIGNVKTKLWKLLDQL